MTIAPQALHWPLRPAASSETENCFPHWAQAKLIMASLLRYWLGEPNIVRETTAPTRKPNPQMTKHNTAMGALTRREVLAQ